MRRATTQKGQSLVEFIIALPFALLLIFTVIEFGLMGVRSIVATHAAMRAARIASTYQTDAIDGELYAMLDRPLFNGSAVREIAPDSVEIGARSRPLMKIRALDPGSMLRRRSPRADALPLGLSEAILRNGDTPSPYCINEGGYRACEEPR